MKYKVKETFNDFCNTTTAHGFSNLVVRSKTARIAWIAILILATGFGALHLYSWVTQYLEYGYHESTVINNDVSPVFPDVTICDNAGVSESNSAG